MRENQKAAGERPDSRRNLRPTIGLLTAQISGELGTSFLTGVAEAAKERDANLITFAGGSLHCPLGFEAQGNVLYDLVTAEVVDGLVIDGGWLSHYVGPEALRDFCARYGDLPLVSVEVPLEGIPSILTDFYQGMRDVMTHLIEVHGYRRIAFIRGPEESLTGEERCQAYQDALAEHDIPLDMDLVAPGTFFEPSGEEAVHLLLEERKVAFEAVAAANDFMAADAMRALQARGVRVPGDVAVTGFDNFGVASAVTPPLTTARLGNYERAQRAADMLLALLAGEGVPKQVTLPAEMVVRQSCGCPSLDVVEAAAGLVTPAGIGISLAAVLAAGRESILSEIAQAVGDPSDGSASQQAERLLDAFADESKGESPGAFLSALESILHQVVDEGGDVAAWQGAMSALRRHALPYLAEEDASARAENLWQQARVMIAETTQQTEAYRRWQAEQQAVALREIGEATITTVEMKDLMDVVAERLPRLSIPRSTISLYEPDTEATAGSTGLLDQATEEGPGAPVNSRLILAYDEGKRRQEAEGQVFPSRQLVSGGLLDGKKRWSMVVEPLHFRKDQLGFALFEMGPREGAVYEALRGQISSALKGALRVQQVQEGQAYLRSLYQASGSITSLRDPETILKDITTRTCETVGACQADVVLIDKAGRPQRLARGGPEQRVSTMTLVESMGISMEVMQNNEPNLIGNMRRRAGQATHSAVETGIGAAGCFPLRHREKPVGVMWIYYPEPHRFSPAEVDALQLYVNQAAIAYDNAQRMLELEHLHQAAKQLASVAGIQEVLRQITRSAREVLQADSVVVWSYDAALHTFLLDELAADGVDEALLDKYREEEPRPGGTAAIVIERGYLAVTDVDAPEHAYLNPPARGLRDEVGVKSFQGIALKAEGEPLGVLYVNYQQPRRFDRERSTLEAFAYHAALALKKARLLEQVRRAHDTARVVAKASVLEGLQRILNEVVEGTRDALVCDAVTLFVYNPVTNRLDHPPTMVGVWHEDRASSAGEVLQDSIVYEMLQRDEPYIVEVVARDALFRGRRFVKDEEVKSCVAIPLRAANQKVGVMFVNYRTRHRFTGEELADIELFAHQAAAAIRDAQLHEETKKRATHLETLYEAGKAVTSTLALDEILHRITEQARLITGWSGGQAHFSYLALMEGNRLKLRAASPPAYLSRLQERAGYIDLERDMRIGITGRAVTEKQSHLVPDVTQDPDYIEGDPETRSELAVPIKLGDEVIGVIDVEHPKRNAFGEEDQHWLESLAAQAAIAIHNAQRHKELLETQKQLAAKSALAWMGLAGSTWLHSVTTKAIVIKENAQALRGLVATATSSEKVEEKLKRIEDQADEIQNMPITPPLSMEEGVELVGVNALLRERIPRVCRQRGEDVQIKWCLKSPDTTTVSISPEWLRRALDILVENAIEAMAACPTRLLTVSSEVKGEIVDIGIADIGKGIPKEYWVKLFHEPIPSDKGIGMGLLLAWTIVQAYGGSIRLETTDPPGTLMVISLPLKQSMLGPTESG